MKKISKLLLMYLSLVVFQCANAAGSPLGYWKTIDDVTDKPKSILHIYEKNGALFGQIVKTFPQSGHDPIEVCSACTGDRHNKRILEMVIMEGLKQSSNDPDEWSDGEIMDPLNGKTYRCTIQVVDNGAKLNVRGYIGVPLFGRSQTWLRVANASSD